MKVKEEDLKLAKEIKSKLQQKLGRELLAVYLYGSRARGTAHEESDMDLFLLLKGKSPKMYEESNDKILDAIVPFNINSGYYISAVAYGEDEYKKNKNLMYIREVKKGIKL